MTEKDKFSQKRALEGLKVLEYGDYISAPYCTKILAGLGAEVVKIERPGTGDSSRREGPFPNDVPHPERSGLFLFLNNNKLGITLNLETARGLAIFDELLKKADIFVENLLPKRARELGLDYQRLKGINPGVIVTSITPFGQTGPYCDYKAYASNSAAISGWTWIIGEPGREPLTPPLSPVNFMGGVAGAIGTQAALFARLAIGRGQHVDVSEVECVNNIFTGVLANAWVYYRRKRMRTGHRTPHPYPYTVLPCKDGYMWMIAVQGYQWKRFLEIMGEGKVPEWYANDPRFKDRLRAGREYADELDALLEPWLMSHTKAEIFAACRQKHIPFAPVRGMDEVVNCPHLNERGFFVEFEHPEVGKLKYPGPPYRLSKTPWKIGRPAPLLGQHNEEVYCGWLGYSKGDLVQFRRAEII